MNRRSGFSLIELLVVLTIIGIVAAMFVGAYGPTLAAGRVANTKSLLKKLGSMVEERVKAVEKDKHFADGAGVSGGGYVRPTLARFNEGMAGNAFVMSPQLADEISKRHNYRMALPQRLEDLLGYDALPGTRDDSRLLKTWLSKTGGVLRPAGHQTKNESAKLLYLALSEGGLASQIRDGIEARHIAYLDQNDKAMGLPAFVDGWGNPIRFYNWPTRLIRPNGPTSNIDPRYFHDTAKVLVPSLNIPPTPSPFPPTIYSAEVNQDPNDPRREFARMLSSTTLPVAPFRLTVWDATGTPYANDTCPPLDINQLYELATWNRPLVVSAGEDGEFGLEETTAAGANRLCRPIAGQEEALADNFTSLQDL